MSQYLRASVILCLVALLLAWLTWGCARVRYVPRPVEATPYDYWLEVLNMRLCVEKGGTWTPPNTCEVKR